MEQFKSRVKNIEELKDYKQPIAFGIANVDSYKNKSLQASFPVVNYKENYGSFAIFVSALLENNQDMDFSGSEFVANIDINFINTAIKYFEPFMNESYGDKHKNIQVIKAVLENIDTGNFKFVAIFEDNAVQSVESAYLKLHLLSLKKVKPREINLDGVFGALPNVAWSGGKPYSLDYLRENEIVLKMSGNYPHIDYVDKFPRYLSHIIPEDNTRILESSKVRFGAYVSAGTTVMPGASYINFNAGTLGVAMVEGRISSSAIVGNGTDLGGGSSILGVLSGTDGNPISVGENCLLGVNSVCGIPLGDGCIIDAGISVLAGSKMYISNADLGKINEINNNALEEKTLFKGVELSGLNGLHFRIDSQSGQMVAKRSTREIKLNESLH